MEVDALDDDADDETRAIWQIATAERAEACEE